MANGPVAGGIEIDANGNPLSSGDALDFATLLPQILEKFVQVMEATAIIIGSIFLIRYLRKRFQKVDIAHAEQRTAINLIEKITTGFIIVIAVTLALKVVGIDMTLLVGVAVLGLSYGLQDIIKNYVAGILILFKAPFKIGEIVKIREFTGKVLKMDFQSTTLETFDNRHITIYNSDVMTQSIVNFSNNTMRRLEFDITTGYGSDIQVVLQIFQKILEKNDQILKIPKYSVVFKKFVDAGMVFTLKFWVQRPCNVLKIRTEIAQQINQSFDEQKILMPYSKSIQVEDENQLSNITEDHKKRIQSFYSLPLFLEPAALPIPVTPDTANPNLPAAINEQGQIVDQSNQYYDFEEPE